jgi:hypothetical protein
VRCNGLTNYKIALLKGKICYCYFLAFAETHCPIMSLLDTIIILQISISSYNFVTYLPEHIVVIKIESLALLLGMISFEDNVPTFYL